MTDGQALFRAVLAEPADDLKRLVMADFLDESGEPERAAYVRASVELARLVDADRLDSDEYAAAVAAGASVPPEAVWGWAVADGLPLSHAPNLVARNTAGAVDAVRDAAADLSVGFRRGFPAVVRCRAADWAASAYRSAAVAPLERVKFGDRRPYHHRPREWVWRLADGVVGGPSNVLPVGVFNFLAGRQSAVAVYPTRRRAEDALSDACLSLARRLLG